MSESLPTIEDIVRHDGPARIVWLGDPVLETPAREVETFDIALADLVKRMFETMYAAQGVGLAAPQIGIPLRVCVINVPRHGPITLINPKIVHAEGEDIAEEGCLSIPGFREQVSRPEAVIVDALSKHGHPFSVEGDSLFARALQHEIDHLNGILFIKRLNGTRERVIRSRFRRGLRG